MRICYFVGFELIEGDYEKVIGDDKFSKFKKSYEYKYNRINRYPLAKYSGKSKKVSMSEAYNKKIKYDEFLFPCTIDKFWTSWTYVYFLPKKVLIANKDKVKCFIKLTNKFPISLIKATINSLPWDITALCLRYIKDDNMMLSLLNKKDVVYSDYEIMTGIVFIEDKFLRLNALKEDITRRINKNHKNYQECYKQLLVFSMNDNICIESLEDVLEIFVSFEPYFTNKIDRTSIRRRRI